MAKPSGWPTSCSPPASRSSTSAPTSGSTAPPSIERWYGEPHARPELLGQLRLRPARILPRRDRRARSASPRPAAIRPPPAWRCSPLVEAGAIEKQGIIVDAASGVSGAGRAANAGTHFCAVDGNFRAYGLLNHRHTAEMEMMIGGERAVHPAPDGRQPGHPRHLLREGDRRRAIRSPSCATPMPASPSSMSAKPRPRPNGRPAPTPPSSPPATTSGPARSSRSPRSTISARARRGR